MQISSVSVNFEFGVQQSEFGRPDQLGVRNDYLEELAVELCGPEIQELFELWKARCQIVILPDVALQKNRMIGQAVNDLGRRQAEARELGFEVLVGNACVDNVCWFHGHGSSPSIGRTRTPDADGMRESFLINKKV